jgi:hypothetical protein
MTNDASKPKRKGKSKAQALVELIRENCTLWNGGDGVAYATFRTQEHLENWRITAPQFREWAYGLYFTRSKDVISRPTWDNLLCLVKQQALQDAPQETYRRVARVGDTIYVDLGDAAWSCVKVDGQGWALADSPAVKFLRGSNTGALPMPEHGGSMDELRPLVTSCPENWERMKGFILDAYKGRKPYFALAVHGTQGSAKTYACRLIRTTIDPVRKAPLARLPRDERELGVTAQSEYVLAYDNVSHLPQWLSDALCAVSTGGGFKARTLYTDDEQTIFDCARPIILNGIPQCVESNDLLSRALLVEQPMITDEQRREETELDAEYEAVKGRVMGGILDCVSKGLANHAKTTLPRLPRMADSVKWVSACYGNDVFVKAYAENEEDAAQAGLDSSPIARAVIRLLDKVAAWEGTAEKLLREVADYVPYDQRGRDFPANYKALGRQLRRDTPLLLKAGLRVDVKRDAARRTIRIDKGTPLGS